MKLNEECDRMIFGANEKVSIRIEEAFLNESTEKNLLGFTYDRSLSFKQHAKPPRKQANSVFEFH